MKLANDGSSLGFLFSHMGTESAKWMQVDGQHFPLLGAFERYSFGFNRQHFLASLGMSPI